MNYPKLFEKGRIGGLELKNRIVMTAMGCGFASSTGEASDEIIQYYADRARGGAGLIITEITRIDDETGIGMSCQLSVTQGKHVNRLVRLAEAVHKYDSKIFVQLHHPGNQTPGSLLNGLQIVSASDVTCKTIGEKPRALTTEEVEAMVKKFIKGAVIAQKAGIDGVEIHAAHGYLINQFMSPHSNKRTDKYGGDFMGRMRFLTEIIKGIQAICGPKFPIIVRMDGNEYIPDGIDDAEGIKMAKYIEALGVQGLNVSCGTYESGATIIEPACYKSGWRKHLAANIRKEVNIPVIAVNTIKTPAFAESLLEEGVSDFIGIGRGFLADAEWGLKAKQGRECEIRQCLGCMECFRVANLGRQIECTVNPILGREWYYSEKNFVKNGDGRTVAVVGAGPAGMQASVVLAKRGFKPVLFEKAEVLGGSLNLANKPPHKELVTELIKTMSKELELAGVDVRLGVEATPEIVKETGAVGVFLGAGGSPIVPPLPGIESAVKAEDILSGKVEIEGKTIAVIGGGVTGLETAEFLGTKGNKVTVVEMLPDVGMTLYPSVKFTLLGRIAEQGGTILKGHALQAIDGNKVEMKVVASGEIETIEVDQVVLALGVRPVDAVTAAFEAEFDEVVRIGDASVGGTIKDALHAGYDKAFAFMD